MDHMAIANHHFPFTSKATGTSFLRKCQLLQSKMSICLTRKNWESCLHPGLFPELSCN